MATIERRLERLEQRLAARDTRPMIGFLVGVEADGARCDPVRGGTLSGHMIEREPGEPLEAFVRRVVEAFPPARGAALAVYMLAGPV